METQEIIAKGETEREVVIDIEHLYKSFETNAVLKDFSLQLHRGESIVLLGRSGSGKSVLIKCIVGLITPERGTIEIFGQDVSKLDIDTFDRLRAKIGFLFQGNALYDSMTVRRNLEFPLRHWMTLTQDEINEKVKKVLEDVGLPHSVDMMPAELSGGMRKRIALARTLIMTPNIILYDEPTTGLDTITGKEIIELMISINRKYKTSSLIISHDMNCVKMAADTVAILWEGKCYAQGTYQQLLNSADQNIHQFFT